MIRAERSLILTQSRSRAEESEVHAQRAARQAGPWVERLARLGYVAKGVVYSAIGFLALREALDIGAKIADPSGVMHSIGM